MKDVVYILISLVLAFIKARLPGGRERLELENAALRQQLEILNRTRKRSPPLTTVDKIIYAFFGATLSHDSLMKNAITIKPATILKFHRLLVQRKYKQLFSSPNKAGRKVPSQDMIDLILAFKLKNPRAGYGRIAMQIYHTFGVRISRFAVGRILRQHGLKPDPGGGPSWPTFFGNIKDSLWCIDLMRCESVGLKSHWVMVVIDLATRSIVDTAVYQGNCTTAEYCRMFNQIRWHCKSSPQFISTDNDPLYQGQWHRNLSMLDIVELKSVPYVPVSHPFIERTIGTLRREFLDQILFLNAKDLQQKLDQFQAYFNHTRAHSALDGLTPVEKAENVIKTQISIPKIHFIRWQKFCHGLFCHPVS